MGSVRLIILNADAYYACLTHALSNEKEEVMGLCIGETQEKLMGTEIHVTASMSLGRLDKQKDRVEISVEQLSNASTKVEEMAKASGKPLRIVGWYHSHPHITVWPSHVDISTQAMYQMMDKTFVGLIFSCFNENKSNQHTVQLACFQSIPAPEWESQHRHEMIEIPIKIAPTSSISPECMDALKELPKLLLEEESEAFEKASKSGANGDFMTKLSNSCVYIQALCKLNNTLLLPMLQVTERANELTEEKIKKVELENETLRRKIEEKRKEKKKTEVELEGASTQNTSESL